MNTDEHRENFAQIVSLPDKEIDLIEAALLIAAENEDISNTDRYRNLIRKLANRYEENYNLGIPLEWCVSRLTGFIHEEEGFGGNVRDYYAPENSYLNRVLDTRQGIPITLALIHIGIGRELDLAVGGINFPGHFLVRYGKTTPLIVDPFSGRILSETDCNNLLKQVSGGKIDPQDSHFDFSPNKKILSRILDNLKQIFWRDQLWNETQSCIDRQLLINPESNELTLQLGAIYELQGDATLAKKTYLSVLEKSKDQEITEIASNRILALLPTPTIRH